jgi:O-antigen ligase
MNRETLDSWCERIILGLVLAILVFAPLALGAAGTWEFLVIQALTIAVMLAWAARLWISPKPQLLWPPICWAVLAFTVYAVARYLTADLEYVARQELIQVLVCAFLFFAIINNLYRQEFSQVISFTLIFLAMFISGYAVYQFMTHSTRVWNLVSPYPGRGMGTFFSPDKFAGFLEMLLPLAVAYIIAGRIKPVTRVLLGYAALVMLAGLTVTFSRGGWAAAAAGLLTLLGILVSQRNHRIPAILLLAVLVGGGVFFVRNYLSKTTSYVNRVEKLGNEHEDFLVVRGGLWTAAIQMWRDNFWWGVGPGLFDYRYPAYRSELMQGRPGHAHNDYLNLLADWGAVGGVIVLAGIASFAVGLGKTSKCVRRAEKDFGSGTSNRLAFFLGASTGLLALAVHSVVDFNLHIPANAILGVTLLALLSSNWRFATERYWLNLRLPAKALATCALAGVVAYLGCQESRRAAEYEWLARAERLPDFSPERIAAWENAFAIEPDNFDTAYNIGEAYRVESFIGNPGYESLAASAMQWFQRAMKINPYDGFNDLGCGICLDWLERHDEAATYFNRADALAPNNYYVADYIGWHYAQTGDYAAARTWLHRSVELQNDNPVAGSYNPIARSYLQMVEQKMMEDANGQAIR